MWRICCGLAGYLQPMLRSRNVPPVYGLGRVHVQLCCPIVRPRLNDVGPMFGPGWAYVGLRWAYVGPMLDYVSLCRAHVGPMLSLCWPYAEPSWRLCWAYVGDMLAILGVCWAYVSPSYLKIQFFTIFSAPQSQNYVKTKVF